MRELIQIDKYWRYYLFEIYYPHFHCVNLPRRAPTNSDQRGLLRGALTCHSLITIISTQKCQKSPFYS